jgi:outer membrane protein
MNQRTIPTHTSAVRAVFFSLLLGLLLAPGLNAQAKIGLLDLKKVFDGYFKTKQADVQLKERAGDFEKMRKTYMDDFEKAKAELETLQLGVSDQALSEEEREKRKAAAQKKFTEIRQIETDVTQFDRTSRSTLAEQQRRMRDRILDQIKEVVTAKAKAKGFSLVLDTAADSANQTPIVLFTTGENDITDEVLTELNSRSSLDLPLTEDAGAKPEST